MKGKRKDMADWDFYPVNIKCQERNLTSFVSIFYLLIQWKLHSQIFFTGNILENWDYELRLHVLQGPPGATGAEGRQGEKGAKVICSRIFLEVWECKLYIDEK